VLSSRYTLTGQYYHSLSSKEKSANKPSGPSGWHLSPVSVE